MKQLLPLLAVAVAATACINDRLYMDPSQNAFGDSSINATDGYLRGDIGQVRNIDTPASRVNAFSDPEWNQTNVTVEAEPNGNVGMIIVNLNGVDLDQLPVGVTQFDNFQSEGEIYVLGCSGLDGNIDYDEPADNGTITVTQSPEGVRNVEVTGNWLDRDANGNPVGEPTVATGSFSYSR